MKFKFHRWLTIGTVLEVDANSLVEAKEKVDRMIETENVADMDTECSGLDCVEEKLAGETDLR